MVIDRLKPICCALVMAGVINTAATTVIGQEPWNGKMVRYGTMHEALGEQKSEGRVKLADIAAKPHFYGVAALEGLKGEITFVDSDAVVTAVGADRKLSPVEANGLQATLLAGAYVPSWQERNIDQDVPATDFDRAVRQAASEAGIDTSQPFVFTALGEFSEVRLHVINGACPMHARRQKSELRADERPFEAGYARIRGTLVGIYAEDAVGQFTHPGTATHVHLIFKDEASGTLMTGHVEQIGLSKGMALRLPQ